MLFTPENARLILEGKKWQTRRLVKPDQWLEELNGAVMYKHHDRSHRLKWQVGRIYAIQPGRGRFGIGFIRLTAIRMERLCEISHMDAVAEGITGGYVLAQFVELWDSINRKPGTRWQANPEVFVLTFERVQDGSC